MANSFPGSGLAYADAFSVGTANAAASSLYVASSCVQAVRIEHGYNQTNLHHNTLWLRATNSGANLAASIGFTVVNNGGDHHRANIAATANSGQIGGNLALYTRNNNGNDQLGYFQDHAGNVGIGTSDFTNVAFGSPSIHVVGSRATLGLSSSNTLATIALTAGNCSQTALHINHDNTGTTQFYNYRFGGVAFTFTGEGKFGVGTTSPIGNTKADIRTSCPLTAPVGQPLFVGSNDVTGPLGVVIQHLCGHGVCRVDFTSTRYGISGNDLSLNVDSSDPNTGGGLYIKYRGNVGIGTSSPDTRLHIKNCVNGSTNNFLLTLQNTCTVADARAGIAFLDNDNTAGSGGISGASIQVANNGVDGTGHLLFSSLLNGAVTERMRINSTGNIGVGTSSPLGSSTERTLHLSDAGGGYATLYVTNAANSVKGIVAIASSQQTVSFGSQSNHALRLITNDTTRMLINTGGCAGIGTTTPCTFLVVKGGAGSAKTDLLSISTADGAGSQPTMRFDTIESNSNILGRISTCDLGVYSSAMIFEAAGCKVNGNSTTTEIMRLVGSTGNVGMGIASPSYKLHVNGTFYAAGSSIDYKQGICNYNTDSCLFMCLKPVTYQYKDEYTHLGKELKSKTQIGLIAEDVADVYPELAILVNEDEQKVVRNVDYEKLSIILLSEVQKLRKEVDNLKNNK